jgi:hypothetical protein
MVINNICYTNFVGTELQYLTPLLLTRYNSRNTDLYVPNFSEVFERDLCCHIGKIKLSSKYPYFSNNKNFTPPWK